MLALFVGQTLLGPTLRQLLAGPGVAGRVPGLWSTAWVLGWVGLGGMIVMLIR